MALSELGRSQAAAIARRLESEPFDRIYSSDLSRALETARAIAQTRDAPVVVDPRLREFHFGQWEGLTWTDVVERWPDTAGSDWREARAYAPEGGETFDAVVERVGQFLRELRESGLASVAVVTHAGVLHAALRALNVDEAGVVFAPASLTRLAIEGEHARVVALNDVVHLESVR